MKKDKNKGFALLLGIVIATAIISVGTTIYVVANKELSTSITSRESQVALYAAESGKDCAKHWLNMENDGWFSRPSFPTDPVYQTVTCNGISIPVSMNNISASTTEFAFNFSDPGSVFHTEITVEEFRDADDRDLTVRARGYNSPAGGKQIQRDADTETLLALSFVSYSWQVSIWGVCSAPCDGTGTETRTVQCLRDDTGAVVADAFCSAVTKPSDTRPCNGVPCGNPPPGPCPPVDVVTEYGETSASVHFSETNVACENEFAPLYAGKDVISIKLAEATAANWGILSNNFGSDNTQWLANSLTSPTAFTTSNWCPGEYITPSKGAALYYSVPPSPCIEDLPKSGARTGNIPALCEIKWCNSCTPINQTTTYNASLCDGGGMFNCPNSRSLTINAPQGGDYDITYTLIRGNSWIGDCQCKESLRSWINGTAMNVYYDQGGATCENAEITETFVAGQIYLNKGNNSVYLEHYYKNNNQLRCDGSQDSANSIKLKAINVSANFCIPPPSCPVPSLPCGGPDCCDYTCPNGDIWDCKSGCNNCAGVGGGDFLTNCPKSGVNACTWVFNPPS